MMCLCVCICGRGKLYQIHDETHNTSVSFSLQTCLITSSIKIISLSLSLSLSLSYSPSFPANRWLSALAFESFSRHVACCLTISQNWVLSLSLSLSCSPLLIQSLSTHGQNSIAVASTFNSISHNMQVGGTISIVFVGEFDCHCVTNASGLVKLGLRVWLKKRKKTLIKQKGLCSKGDVLYRTQCHVLINHRNVSDPKTTCPVGWGCRIHQLHFCRWVRPSPTSVLDMTLNNLIVGFQ